MSLSKKAQQIARDIEVARLHGRWSDIPNLARRFLKHHPSGNCFYHLILAEYHVYQFFNSLKEIDIYLEDSPKTISFPAGIAATEREALENHTLEAVKYAVGSDEKKDTAILKALFQCLTGDYVEALQTLNDAQWPALDEEGKPVVVEGYRCLLAVQGWVVRGVCQEATALSTEGAIDSFLKARQLLEAYQGEQGDTFIWWLEETLYRLPLFYLRNGDQVKAIENFRIYRDQCMHWPPEFRPVKRLVLCRYCIPILSDMYKHGNYQPPTYYQIFKSDTPTIQVPLTFRQEILQLHELYEDAVHRCTKFPRSGHLNRFALDMANQIMHDRELIGPTTRAERRAVVELLYRTTELTFQSPAIMRHLVHALIALGEYEEAELALSSFANMITKKDAIAPPPDTSNEEEVKSINSTFVREDAETPQQAIETLLTGARLKLCELGKAEDCVRLAEMAIDLCEEYKKAIPAELYAKAWQLTGIGYGMMAREVHQKEQRATLYEKAIQALNLAVSHHADNAEAYYHLALQHADGRNIGQAMVAIKQSLQLDPMRVRAWHLLVLLVSATKDLEGALRLCQVGLDASEWQVNPDGSGEQQGSASEGEDVLALMMTRVALEEALYGPLQALERLNALFVLYGRVFAGDGGGSAASEMNTTVRREAAAERPARSLGSSRRHAQQPSTGRSTRLDVPMSSYAGSVTGGQTGARSAPTVASSRSSYSLASRVTTRVRLRRQRALKALTELWLVSAASFQRMKRYDDARQAIEEAESADSESAAVSCQAGLLLLEQGKIEEALTAFSKAVFLEPHHVQGTVLLARANMLLGKCPLAEGLLRTTTRGRGWNHADAWYYLGNVYRQTERVDRAKECFWYALDLESTRPIRPFYTLLP